jgi:hypothetical protein
MKRIIMNTTIILTTVIVVAFITYYLLIGSFKKICSNKSIEQIKYGIPR